VLQSPLKMLHLGNPPNRKTQIPRYLAVQIQNESLVYSEFVPINFLKLVDFGGVVVSVGSVVYMYVNLRIVCVCAHMNLRFVY